MDAIVGMSIGHTSMQERDLGQSFPKCSPYVVAISLDFSLFRAYTRYQSLAKAAPKKETPET